MQLETKLNKPTIKLMIYIICTDVSLCSEAEIFYFRSFNNTKRNYNP